MNDSPLNRLKRKLEETLSGFTAPRTHQRPQGAISRTTGAFIQNTQQAAAPIAAKIRMIPQTAQKVVEDVRQTPLSGRSLLFPNGIPNTPTVGQAYDSLVKPSVDTVVKGAQAAPRVLPRMLSLTSRNPLDIYNNVKYLSNPKQAVQDTMDVANAGLTVYGANKIKPMLAVGAPLLGGALSKATGGSFTEGATKTAADLPKIAGLTSITNPLIGGTVGKLSLKFTSPTKQFVANRVATGALNVPEGMAISQSLGHDPLDPRSIAADFALGTITGSTKTGHTPFNGMRTPSKANFRLDRRDVDELVEAQTALVHPEKYLADQKMSPNVRKMAVEQIRSEAVRTINHLAQRHLPDKEIIKYGDDWNKLATRLYELSKENKLGLVSDEPTFGIPNMYKGLVSNNDGKIKLKKPSPAETPKIRFKAPTLKDEILSQPPDRARMSQQALDEGITTPRTGADISVLPQTTIRFKVKNQLVTAPGGPGRAPAGTPGDGAPPVLSGGVRGAQPPGAPTGSVLDDIKAGFESGRQVRVAAENASRGSVGQQARSQLVDRLSPVYDFVRQPGKDLPAEKNPYKKMRLLAGTSGKVEAYIDRNVAPILKQEKDRLDDLSALWTLERERELVGRGLVRKRNVQQIEQGLQELRLKYGDEGFRTLQESSTQLRRVGDELLDQLHRAGIIDDDSFAAIKKNNQFYAPMEAVEHIADNVEKGRGTGSFNVASQDAIKRIGDYSGDVSDPIETLVRRIPKVMALVEKNNAIRSLVDLRQQYPDIYGDAIVPIKGTPPPGAGIINVFENGQNVRYAVPDFVEGSIKNLDKESANILVSLTSWQAKILRAGATGLNIGFIPVNTVRDVQDALTTELSEKGAKAALHVFASYPRAILAAARRDDLYKDWLASGGAQSTMLEQIYQSTPRSVKELSGKTTAGTVIKRVIHSPKDTVEFLNRVAEQSTRIARYKAGVERGESTAEAAFKSRDISLDFAKAGNKIRVLNQVVPFLNAGIQGSEKLLRLYKTNPKAATAYTTLLYGVPAVMMHSYNSQFKDYADIPESEKQNNWIFIARDRTPEEASANPDEVIGFKIPKGFLGRMVANPTESMLDFVQQRDPQALVDSGLDLVEGISPVGLPVDAERAGRTFSRILPPGLKAGVEASMNKNLYFGNDVVPQSLEDLPPSEQYKEKTPQVYKLAGKLTNTSPLILENTVNTMTGGLGRQGASLLSGDLEGATTGQVTRRFVGVRGGAQADKAWETVEQEKQYTAHRNKQIKEAYATGDQAEFYRLTEGLDRAQIKRIMQSADDAEAKKALTPKQRAYENLTKEERERLGNERPELKSELELLDQAEAAGGSKIKIKGEEDAVSWDDEDGRSVTVSLAPRDNSGETGIDAFKKDDSPASKARKIWGAPNDQLSVEEKEVAFEKLGFTKEQAEYDYKANFTVDEKVEYILSQNLDSETLRERLLTGRVQSISEQYFITKGVLDELADRGLITDAEVRYYNGLKLDEELNPLKASGGGGKKGRKGTIKLTPMDPVKIQLRTTKSGTSAAPTRPRVNLQLPERKQARPQAKVKLKRLSQPKIKIKQSYFAGLQKSA